MKGRLREEIKIKPGWKGGAREEIYIKSERRERVRVKNYEAKRGKDLLRGGENKARMERKRMLFLYRDFASGL